jgi:NitT/TauT family transport system ATP-binding protein
LTGKIFVLFSRKYRLLSINKTFRTRRGATPTLQDISFDVSSGEFLCLLGPSGCGKSTLLNMVAGLDYPDTGQILADGIPVTGAGRGRVMIFQEAALFPWLNVRDNVAFGLRATPRSRAEQLELAAHYLDMVGLRGFERAYVHEISGGMKQRVALALEPQVLLMDEPFAALDAQTRDMLHTELQAIWMQSHMTIIFVTHNVREALVLGDRVLLMTARPGRVKSEYRCQLVRPRQIEDHALVDVAREVLADLRDEVIAARQESERERMAA